jgi:hypothetical protein
MTCSYCEIVVFLQKVKVIGFFESPIEYFVFVLGLCPSAGIVFILPCQNHSESVILKSWRFYASHICFCIGGPSHGTADHILSL